MGRVLDSCVCMGHIILARRQCGIGAGISFSRVRGVGHAFVAMCVVVPHMCYLLRVTSTFSHVQHASKCTGLAGSRAAQSCMWAFSCTPNGLQSLCLDLGFFLLVQPPYVGPLIGRKALMPSTFRSRLGLLSD